MADNHIINLMFQVHADIKLLYICDDFFSDKWQKYDSIIESKSYTETRKNVSINALVVLLFGNATNPIDVLRDPQKHPREIPRILSIGKGSNSNLHKLSISIAQKRASAVTLKKKKRMCYPFIFWVRRYINIKKTYATLTEQTPLFLPMQPAQRAYSVSTRAEHSVVSKIGRSTVLATSLLPLSYYKEKVP